MPRILIADDSIVFRRLMSDVAGTFEGCTVVGQAHNGKVAMQQVEQLEPDILTLDMEMPEMDGLQVLEALRKVAKPPAVLVVSSLTERGGELTLKALKLGAFDFFTKPQTGSMDSAREELKAAMEPRVRALSLRYNVRDILRKPMVPDSGDPTGAKLPDVSPGRDGAIRENTNGSPFAWKEHRVVHSASEGSIPVKPGTIPIAPIKPEMIVIGVSTGGPNALAFLIPALPDTIGVPVFIVQHMPPLFTQSLANSLEKKSALTVTEAVHNGLAKPNCVYIAPGGSHMRLQPGAAGEITIKITDDAAENNCRPSVDYLFRSVSQHFPGRALSVILTGMGSDGALGVRLLKRTGCISLVQDESSSVVYGMPKAVADAGLADLILPLDRIAETITRIMKRS
ncbi:MAG: chemotaxis-specific protein-glutamate methyltransferase CheB [Balneolaceae bacterium]|nr:MAG: chemotaxis-specific protein-glutamate methyltransferase CheB [Balneolaceae bacterium]